MIIAWILILIGFVFGVIGCTRQTVVSGLTASDPPVFPDHRQWRVRIKDGRKTTEIVIVARSEDEALRQVVQQYHVRSIVSFEEIP